MEGGSGACDGWGGGWGGGGGEVGWGAGDGERVVMAIHCTLERASLHEHLT